MSVQRYHVCDYPNVLCDFHTLPEPGYVVCVHAMAGAPVHGVDPATETDMGIIACTACGPRLQADEMPREEFKRTFQTVCAGCCRLKGWIK